MVVSCPSCARLQHHVHCGHKYLHVVYTRNLAESLCYYPLLVLLDKALQHPLDLEYPLGANCLLSRWQLDELDELPHAIQDMHLNFSQCCLNPPVSVWTPEGLFECL